MRATTGSFRLSYLRSTGGTYACYGAGQRGHGRFTGRAFRGYPYRGRALYLEGQQGMALCSQGYKPFSPTTNLKIRGDPPPGKDRLFYAQDRSATYTIHAGDYRKRRPRRRQYTPSVRKWRRRGSFARGDFHSSYGRVMALLGSFYGKFYRDFYGFFMVLFSNILDHFTKGFRVTLRNCILIPTTRRVPTVNQQHVNRHRLHPRQSLTIMLSKNRTRQTLPRYVRQRNVTNSIRVRQIIRVTIRITRQMTNHPTTHQNRLLTFIRRLKRLLFRVLIFMI